MFRVIVVTWPSGVSEEGARIADFLLNGGVDFVHVRKPGWGRERTEGLILSVPGELRGRLVLHDHFDLAVRYGLGGVRLYDLTTEERRVGRERRSRCSPYH